MGFNRLKLIRTGKGRSMAFEIREAELGVLVGQMRNVPHDWFELHEQIRQKLAEMKSFGMPLPADLVQFEHDLEAEMTAQRYDDKRRARLDAVIAQRGASD